MKKFYFSFKTKTLVLSVVSLLFISFFLTGMVAVLVQHWKQRIVTQSLSLAEKSGGIAADEIEKILETENIEKTGDLKKIRRAHSCIELLLKQNENIVMAALIDSRGVMVIEHFKGEITSGTTALSPGASFETEITGQIPQSDLGVILRNRSEEIHHVELPVLKKGKTIGHLQFGISEDAILNRISFSSTLITKSLGILLVTLFLLLTCSYFILWRIFSRHVKVVKEKDRSDKMATIGTLASGLAHEIRNPLNAMNINLDVIREEIEDPREDSSSKALELVTNLQKGIQQLNQTLSNFMKFALPGKLEKQKTDLVTIVRECLEIFSHDFALKKIKVEMSLPEKCLIKADPGSLKQLLMNLLLNASQAIQDEVSKQINIEIKVDVKTCDLIIYDNGPGFGNLDPEKCFEVFVTYKAGGSGFGLPIARQIANSHGGSLRAENKNPERGAEFILTLPL
jgi:signal transduction histidine kinase